MTMQPFEPSTSTIVPAGADLDALMRYADVFSQSGLLPDTFRSKPANVLTAIALGRDMDESLITITSNLTMVGNKPGWEAKFMRQRARRYGHRVVETFDRGTMTATCTIYRADDPKTPITVVVDKTRAEKSGWWGKGYWVKDPELMLENRALSFCVRKACNEVLGGITYTTDEVRDAAADDASMPSQGGDWKARADAARTFDELKSLWSAAHRAHELTDDVRAHFAARRAALVPAPAPLPVHVESVDEATGEIVDADVLGTPDPITPATGKAIVAAFKALGVERPELDAYLPAFGILVPLAQLDQVAAEELLTAVRGLTRESLADLVREAGAR